MRDYGVVSPQFWLGKTGRALRGQVEAQLVALYLQTSPHANMIGVYYVTLDSIAKETGLTLEGASKGLRSLQEANFCRYDEATEEVFVVRMAAFQIGEQLEAKDNRCKGVARELEKVASDSLRSAFRAIYSVAFHLPPEAKKPADLPPPPQAPSKPLRSQDQDQYQDQKDSVPYGTGGEPPSDPEALRAWLREQVFASGVALLTAADVTEKNARSMLAMLCKRHGEQPVLDAIAVTAREHPGEPVSWLQAILAPKPARASQQAAGKYAAAAQAVFGSHQEVIDV